MCLSRFQLNDILAFHFASISINADAHVIDIIQAQIDNKWSYRFDRLILFPFKPMNILGSFSILFLSNYQQRKSDFLIQVSFIIDAK